MAQCEGCGVFDLWWDMEAGVRCVEGVLLRGFRCGQWRSVVGVWNHERWNIGVVRVQLAQWRRVGGSV